MKKRIIIVTVIVAILCSAFFAVYIYLNKSKKIEGQWALYNNGSKVDGIKGIEDCDIEIEKAWNTTKGKQDIIIAVLDSGLYTDEKKGYDNIYVNKKEEDNGKDDDNNGLIDDISGWNYYDDNNELYSGYYNDLHGTNITSVILGNPNVKSFYGVAPECTVLPLKVIDGSDGNTEDIVKAIKYAHDCGARIVNCSWVFDEYDDELYEAMKEYDDMLFVCVAGTVNEEINEFSSVYPMCFNLDNIISVAAVSNSGEIYEGSGYGKCINVAAPGREIMCLNPENDVEYASGTSIASAYVSGIAGLTLSVNDDLTTNQLKEILCSSVKKIDSLNNKVSNGGIIDANQCVKKAKKY